MNTQIYVWIPFGDLMHEEVVGGPNWKKCQENPAWWAHRVDILERYTLRSLARQTHRDFRVVFGVAEEAGAFPEPLLVLAARLGHRVHRHPASDPHTIGQTPGKGAVEAFLTESDAACVVWLDSDDLYATGALSEIAGQKAQPGLVAGFRRGFIATPDGRRIERYHCTTNYPPFFARWYTPEARGHVADYERLWNFNVCHGRLTESKRLTAMSGGQFCVLVHGANMSTVFESPRVQNKLDGVVDGAARADFRERFGF